MIHLLVTACCDNSGLSRIVTLKSPDEVFALEVFLIHKQITILIYFLLHINLVGDLIPLLVTACCDNSGLSRIVTLKSPGEVFAFEVFLIHKQITVLIYFLLHINLVGDLFVLPHILHINRIN